jgi:hypothetical protein
MITDARTIPSDTVIRTDVCVVGAGAAGITLAHEFRDQGFQVCLLESGGNEPDRDTQSLFWGENTGHPYYPLDTARSCCFGGSTNRWHVDIGTHEFGARMRPLDEIDFEKRDWIPHSGWPFGKRQLDPYYERAQSICRIGPFTYAAENWEEEKSALLPFKGGKLQTVIFQFAARKPFISTYKEEVLRSKNISTYLHANALEIETNDSGQSVTRLRVGCLQGQKFRISARIFILAMGGIEIPRLLLNSDRKQPSGIGNQYHLVGKFFMEHLHFWSGVFIPSDADLVKATGLYNSVHSVNNVPIIGKLAPSEQVLREEKLLNCCAQFIPRVMLEQQVYPLRYPREDSPGVASLKAVRSAIQVGGIPKNISKHVGNVAKDIDGIMGALCRKTRRQFMNIAKKRTHVFKLAFMAEQAPDPTSCLTLSDERDSLGVRRLRLNWHIGEADILSTVRFQKVIAKEFQRAGLGMYYSLMNDGTPPPDLHGGYHHMGTTRMHNDPKQGVVDEHCKVHGISNLFIAGPSVFPTGGYANPVLTLVALSVKLSDHIKKLMRQEEVN